MDPSLIFSKLKDKGCKLTKVRKALVEIYSKTEKPLSAGEAYKIINNVGIKADRTTIYRELQFLVNENILNLVYLTPGVVSYESSALIHHHHLICEKCGSVDRVTNCLVGNIESDIYKKKGFKIRRHSLEFYGTCSSCRNIKNISSS